VRCPFNRATRHPVRAGFRRLAPASVPTPLAVLGQFARKVTKTHQPRRVAFFYVPPTPTEVKLSNTKSEKILSRVDVVERVGVSYPTIWAWSKTGRFPAARSVGGAHDGRVGWLESEVDSWIKSLPIRQYDKPGPKPGSKKRT
jgi:predicted DNA-binding transcriptional regulator AlpA